MNKNKTLILIEADPNTDMFFNDWLKNGYKAEVLYKKVSKPIRAIRRIWMKKNLPGLSLWLGAWFKELNKYETIIVHMNRLTLYLPQLISKAYPKLRIIGWYWNTVDNQNTPIDFNNKNIEYWTFDGNDAIKYNMHKNIQYYCPVNNINEKENEYDVYYIGRNRNRVEKIEEVRKQFDKYKIKYKFKVIEDNSSEITPYSEVKKELLKTRAILEINKKNQVGFTLRTLESLFFEVKLITDNKHIKESPIYKKENIFIIDEDDYSRLNEFLNKSYNHEVDILKNEYCLDKWFNNFDISNVI